MSRVTCRCGEAITVKSDGGPERIDCPRCGSRIRLRRRNSPALLRAGAGESDDGYVRFHCPCGRRLKVQAAGGQTAGKCPDCGRLVPVPESVWSSPCGTEAARVDPDARTEDLDAGDLAMLEEWSARHTSRSPGAAAVDDATPMAVPGLGFGTGGPPPSMVKFEAGLRVCPRCGKPVHLSATTCRECGSPVPRR
jgi:DNA-directed RNA polymerase subunit RPC12/RpoP